jgi:hypothetical protein
MNVHADSLATEYLNHADPSQIIPSIPASQASLIINGATLPVVDSIDHFSFDSPSALAHPNCAHAAHSGLSHHMVL